MAVEPSDIVAGYRLILGREPENEAVVAEKRDLDDMAALRSVLLRSDEFVAQLPALLDDDRVAATRTQIDALYEAMLGRRPDAHALADLGAAPISVARLARRIAASEEYWTRHREEAALAGLRAAPRRAARGGPPRILLFGAYGNGNLGDAAQASALARLVARRWSGAQCEASSWADAAPYDPAPARPRPPGVLLDGEKLAEFDAVLFGGGGLFGPPHFPLDRPAWARWFAGLGIPYGFMGIGVSEGVTLAADQRPGIEALFREAAFVSIRDATSGWSTGGVAPFRDDWFALPDPVLLAGLLDGGGVPSSGGAGTLLIVKAPAPGDVAEEEALEILAAHARAHPSTTRVAVLEPRRDRAVAGAFPSPLIEPPDMVALIDHCAGSERIVSMRLHGAVAGILAGTPTIAGTAAKARALLRDLDCPDNAFADAPSLRRALDGPPPPRPPAHAMERLRRLGEAGLGRIEVALKAAGAV